MSDSYEEALSYVEDRQPEYRRGLEIDGPSLDRWITRDPEPWPDAGEPEDMNLAVPYCAACGYRHSVNSEWCKAKAAHLEVA